MGKTSISWTNITWNPVVGCARVSEGCRHCYAETMAARIANAAQAKLRRGGALTATEAAYREVVRWECGGASPADESLSSLVPPISWALDRFLPLKIAARPEKWPRGAIVAVGTLVEIWPITRYRGEQVVTCQVDRHDHRTGDVVTVGSEPVSDKEEGLGLYCTGRFGWLIADVRRVVPVPAKGRLGLWTFDGNLVPA